ncbi:hypothetical protein NOF04DRAFT_1379764 [Fusarium oxysporum II5]|nr:hypothetical protein NOF04DRAFT_1379764 [Fusarium oxysporum II5]
MSIDRLLYLFIVIAADTMRPGLYSCELCLKKAMDWYPSKREPQKIPKICIDEEDFDREEFYCGNCDCGGGDCDSLSLTRAHGTQRMGSLLERFIQHIKANRRLTKKAYDSKPKTIRLRKKASRAIASYSNRSAADSMKNHRAEHKRYGIPGCQELCVNAAGCQQVSVSPAGATNSDVSSGSSTAAEMPVRCGPNKMPDECLWDLPSDEDEEK